VILTEEDLRQPPHTAKVELFNPLPGGGRSQTLDYEFKRQDFTIEVSPSTVDLSIPTAGTTTVTLLPAPAVIDPVGFTCETSDPRLSCSFSISQTYGWFSSPIASQLTIRRVGTTSASANLPIAPNRPQPGRVPFGTLLAIGLSVLGIVQVRGSRRRLAALLIVILIVAVTQFACGGGGGTHEPPPVVPVATLSATPTAIGTGQSSLLSWSTSNAATVTLDGATVPTRGTQSVSPAATTTYHLLAKGSGGSKEATATVTVINTTTSTVTVKVSAAGVERTATVTVTLPA
jgi:hypothetical protein